jgi:hypothetical protein
MWTKCVRADALIPLLPSREFPSLFPCGRNLCPRTLKKIFFIIIFYFFLVIVAGLKREKKNFGFWFLISKIPKIPKLPSFRGLRGRSRKKNKVFSA